MPAKQRYTTSIFLSFSTFLEKFDLDEANQTQAKHILLAFLNKNNFKKLNENELKKFLAKKDISQKCPDKIKKVLIDFITNHPPYQRNVYLLEFLLALKHSNCSKATIKNYKSDISQFLNFNANLNFEQNFTKPVLDLFYFNQLKQGLKESTLKRRFSSIIQFALWLKEENILDKTVSWLNYGYIYQAPAIPSKKTAKLNKAIKSKTKKQRNFQAKNLLKLVSFRKNHQATARSNQEQRAQAKQAKFELSNFSTKVQNRFRELTPSFVLPYVNLIILVLFFAGLGVFGYRQLFTEAEVKLAYPSSPTSPNRVLSFQGRLTDQAQNPITDSTAMQFVLYDDLSAGNNLWSGSCSVDPDQDGIFAVGLGSDCGSEITEDVFSENSNIWLEVRVGSPQETLSPRQPIRTVAYALNSETLQGYPITATGAATVNTVVTMNEGGEVVLGEVSPKIRSVSGNFTIEGNSLTLQTSSGSDGDIVLAPDGLGGVISEAYFYAPGATLSATYAGGTALTLNAGPTATADIMQWQDSAGTPLGVIDESGNVGIGLTNPSYPLHVTGNLGISNTYDLYSYGSQTLGNRTYTEDNYVTDASTFTAAIDALDIAVNDISVGSGGLWLDADPSDYVYPNSSFSSNVYLDAGNLGVGYDPSAITGGVAAFNGNVGIGTATPSYPLHVAGNLGISDTYDLYSYGSQTLGNRTYTEDNYVTDATTFTAAIDSLDQNIYDVETGTAGLWLDGTPSDYINPNSAYSSNLYLDAGNLGVGYDPSAITGGVAAFNGNVGIGTSSPVAQLQVNSSSASKIGQIVRGAASQTANLQEWQNSSGGVMGAIDTDGNAGFGTNVSSSFSVYSTHTLSGTRLTELGFIGTQNTSGAQGYGIQGEIRVTGSNNVAELFGSYNTVRVGGTSPITVSAARPLWGRLRIDNTNSSATITNSYLISGSIEGSGLATITNLYGLYLPDINVGASSNYSIYTNLGDVSLGDNLILRNDSDRIQLGASQDLELYHDGTNSYITNNTGDLYISDAGTDDVILSNNGGNVGVNTATPSYPLHVAGNLGISDTYDLYSYGSQTLGNRTYTEDNYVTDASTFTAAIDALDQAVYDVSVGSGGLWLDGSPSDYLYPNSTYSSNLYLDAGNLGVGYDPSALTGAVAAFNSNVGIGTSAPTSLLHVQTSATSGTISAIDWSGATSGTDDATALAIDMSSFTPPTEIGVPHDGIGISLTSPADNNQYINNYAISVDGSNWDLALYAPGSGIMTKTVDVESVLIGMDHSYVAQANTIASQTGDLILDPTDDLYITSNVGIGTAAPNYPLEVAGNIGLTSTYDIYSYGSQTLGNRTYTEDNYITDASTFTAAIDALDQGLSDLANYQLWYDNVANDFLYPNSTYSENVFVPGKLGVGTGYRTDYLSAGTVAAFNGNVGIGTTTPGNNLDIITGATTYSEFHLGEAENEGGYISSTTDNMMILSGGAEISASSWYARSTSAAIVSMSAGAINFRTDSGLTDGSTFTPSVRMTIDSAGNVGIGITQPTSLLHLSGGGIKIADTYGIGFTSETPSNATPTTDGARFYYDNDYFGTNIDALIIEKTDSNGNDPDGGIAFINQGQDAVRDVAMVIRGTGNVGIGTTNPLYDLEVQGSALIGNDVDTVEIASGNWNINTAGDFIDDSGDHTISTSEGDIVLSPFTGYNVGIGTASPLEKLHILDNTGKTISDTSQNGTGNLIIQSSYGARTEGVGAALSFSLPSNSAGTSFWDQARILGTADNSTDGNAAGSLYLQTRYYTGSSWDWRNNIVLRSSGNVGINTTNPSAKLDIVGTTEFNDSAWFDYNWASKTGGLNFGTDGSNEGLSFYSGSNNSARIYRDTDNIFYVGARSGSSTDGLAIDQNGNVGIGITNATTALYVQRTGASAQIKAETITSGVASLRLVDASGGDILLRGDSGNSYINHSGNLGIGTTTPSGKVDIAYGGLSLVLGADSNATSRTNSTIKYGRIGGYHYTNSEEPIAGLFFSGLASANNLYIGGGTSYMNAATELRFYTAANNTTTTGSTRMTIDSAGNVGVGTTTPTTPLDVNGLIRVRNPNGVAAPTRSNDGEFAFAYVATGRLYFRINSTIFYINASASGDFSEYFIKDDPAKNYVIGSLMAMPSGKATLASSTNVPLGIVSEFGTRNNDDNMDGMRHEDPNYVNVGLLGQLPAIVTNLAGEINSGDQVGISLLNGIGSKQSQSGYSMATAKSDTLAWNSSSCQVVSSMDEFYNHVNNAPVGQCFSIQVANLDSATAQNLMQNYQLASSDSIKLGKIDVYVKSSWYDPKINSNIAETINLNSAGEVALSQDAQGNYQVTQTADNSIVGGIEALAQLVSAKITAGLIDAQEIISQTFTATQAIIADLTTSRIHLPAESSLDIINSQGETVASIDQEGNTKLAALNADSINTASLSAQTINTQNLSASGSTLLADLSADYAEIASLSATSIESADIQTDTLTATSSRLAYLETQMAEIEQIQAQTAQIMGDATISGKLKVAQLEADSITATTINGSDTFGLISSEASLSADQIIDFDEKVAQAFKQPSLLATLLGDNYTADTQEVIDVLNSAGYEASGAASLRQSLAQLDLSIDDVVITPSAAYISHYFEVNGSAYIADSLGVGNYLLVGEGMKLSQNSLDVIASETNPSPTLHLQPSGVGQISLLAGVMTLSDNGKVVIDGDLEISGRLAAKEVETETLISDLIQSNQITPENFDEPLKIQVAGASTESGEVKRSSLQIVDELGIPVATISAQGQAEFSSLALDSQDLSGENDINNLIARKTTGKALLKAGETEISIKSDLINKDTRIYVTPLSSTNNQVLYVKNQTEDKLSTPEIEGGFTVGFDETSLKDVEFNWWIVN